ncbi:MAG: DUF2281 domain-containing protein [Bacteroidota bacterium]
MELKFEIGFEQLFSLAKQLPTADKKKLIEELEKLIPDAPKKKKERKLGRYKAKIRMSADFNEPLNDFKDDM